MPHSPTSPLSGRVILIVGVAEGAGVAALGQALVDQGASLAMSDADPRALGRVALPLNALPLPADPDSLADAQAVIAEVIDSLDRLDAIVGAAEGGAFAMAARAANIPALPACADTILRHLGAA